MNSAVWLSDLIDRGEAIALIESGRSISYAELTGQIHRWIRLLGDASVRAGDVVALNSDFSLSGISSLLALAHMGAIVAPVVNLNDEVAGSLYTDCGAQYVLRPHDADLKSASAYLDHPLYARLRASGASGLVLLSSGSTGKAKAIVHDLDLLIEAKRKAGGRARLSILLFLLFDHIGGINTLFNSIFSGTVSVIPGSRTPDAICELVQTHGVNILPTSPTFINLVMMSGALERWDLSSLRLITYGTEAMPETLLQRVRSAFPRARLLQTFGTSETGIAGTRSAESGSTLFKFDDPTQEFRIVEGELQIRSRTQFLGYLNNSDQGTTDDGWFRTGDAAEVTADGFLRIRGRLKEVINVGGEKVLPLELESLLLQHPWVDECVVYGVANAITGQAVHADVRTVGVVEKAALRQELHAFLAPRVARYKIPARFNMVEQIDVSERFKKRRLRA